MGESFFQVALTLLSAGPGVGSADYAAQRCQGGLGDVVVLEPDHCLQQLVCLSWCILSQLDRAEAEFVVQATRVHKAHVSVDDSGGGDKNDVLLWWAKACDSDRAAEVLMPAKAGMDMWDEAMARALLYSVALGAAWRGSRHM